VLDRSAKLHGRREALKDAAPIALVVGAATMALVDDDEIEKIRRVFAEVGGRV
jgi:hypothetical protein